MNCKEAHELHCDSDTCRARPEEENPVVAEGAPGCSGTELGGIGESTEDDCSRSLDVVVEYGITVSVSFQVLECVIGREVL